MEESREKADYVYMLVHCVLLGMHSFLFLSDGTICQLQGVLFFDRMTDQVLDSIREELEVNLTLPVVNFLYISSEFGEHLRISSPLS